MKMLRNIALLLLLVGCFSISRPQAAFAQGIITGTITGTITDSTGAVISNAPIVATNAATGIKVTSKTDSAGLISLKDVPIGTYTVVITASGFSPLTVANIEVAAGGTASIGTQHLSIGNSVQVEVSTAQNLIETTQSQITNTFSAQTVTDLPTGGGLDRLALLVPGVVRTLSNNDANTNGVGFSSNGQRGRSNNFEIDGQSNNDNSVTGPQFFFRNEDAVQQIQVLTNNFEAQYGRNAGSIVNYITKSGTNSFHGTLFENYFGSWGSSLTQGQKSALLGFCAPGQVSVPGDVCAPVVVPRVTANEFGGSVGGPVFKDKLFFFAGILFRRVTNGASPSISTTLTPTPTGIQQLQTAFPGNPLIASLTNQGPYSVKLGNPSPVATSNVTVCASTTACPAGSPTVQFGTIQRLLPSTSSDNEQVYRGDYQATNKDRFYLRFMYQNAPTQVAGGTISTGNYYNTTDNVYSVGADYTRTFSTNWVNQLRYSFQQSTLTFGDGGYPGCDDADLLVCPSSIAITGFAGYGQANNIPQGRIVKATQVQDNVSWSRGQHQITFGGEFDYQNSPNVFLPNTSGTFSFPNGFNAALAGIGTLSLANGNPNIPFKEPDFAGYFQDDWKIRPNLTLNLGLRWEFFKQSINLLHDESVARQTGPDPIWLTSLPLSLTTFPFIPQNYKNYEPRVGFAYNPPMFQGMVIRGGFSINYDPSYYNLFLNVYTAAPIVNTGIITCNGTTVNCLPTGGTTNALVNAQNAQYNPTGVNPGTKVQTSVNIPFKNPVANNYTLGVQQQLNGFVVMEVRYVGNHSYDNFQNLNGNALIGPPGSTISIPGQGFQTLSQGFPNLFPSSTYCTTPGAVGEGTQNCNLTTQTIRGNTAFSDYNALQTQIRMQNFHGLTANAAYTWSRTIDNASEVYSTLGGGATITTAQSPFNTDRAERGVSGQSYPNVFSLGGTYKVPAYSEQRGFVGRLLGGYSLNTIWTYNSGQPYTPYQGTKANPGGVVLQNATGTAANPNNLTVIPYNNQGQALYSFCDYNYNTNVIGDDSCRPILSNPTAPTTSVGWNAGPGVGYLNFSTGKSISPSSVHWLLSNQYEAIARGNPYPGVSRNTLRGNTVNQLDMSLFKTVKINEKISSQLRMNVFNLPNRAYYQTPDSLINDANPTVHNPNYSSFNTFLANSGTLVTAPFGKGTRNIQLGAKIIF